MTKEQEAHLKLIQDRISNRIAVKYRRGQAEHGGNLWERPALPDMRGEVSDFNTYFVNLEEQLKQMHELVKQAREHTTNCDWGKALFALDQLDAGFRLQLTPDPS